MLSLQGKELIWCDFEAQNAEVSLFLQFDSTCLHLRSLSCNTWRVRCNKRQHYLYRQIHKGVIRGMRHRGENRNR